MSSAPEFRPEWRIVSPAPRTAALDLAGAQVRMRRMVLAQTRVAETVAIYRGDEPIALAFLARHGWRRIEMALSLAPDAAQHMRRLVRIAQLTLDRVAETRLVIVHVHPANRAGQRMAMLTGFRRAIGGPVNRWVYRGRR
jgi:hypothetical protein